MPLALRRIAVLTLFGLVGCAKAPPPEVADETPIQAAKDAPAEKAPQKSPDTAAPTSSPPGSGRAPWMRGAAGAALAEKGDPNRIELPKDGGAWPWGVAAAAEVPATKPTWIHDYVFVKTAVTGVVVHPGAGEAVLFLVKGHVKDHVTEIYHLDLKSGVTIRKWSLPGSFYPFDWHADRNRLLVLRRNNYGEDLTKVELWTVAADGALNRQSWKPDPHVPDPKSQGDHYDENVSWAGFVGAGHVATLSGRGRFALWDAATLKRTGWLDAATALPAVTPDGGRVAVLTTSGVVLLDPAKREPVGVKPLGRCPEYANLAFSPNGRTLACVGKGRILTLDLESGDVRTHFQLNITPTGYDAAREVGFAGPRHVWVNGLLYDPAVPIPLCSYGNLVWAKPFGDRVWAVVKPRDGDGAALVSHALPHPGLESDVRGDLSRTDVFLLRAGDTVQLDVSGVDAGRRETVRSQLQKALRTAGYAETAGPGAKAVLRAAVDAKGRPAKVTYHDAFGFGKPVATIGYTIRDAHARFLVGEKVVWEESAHVPPPRSVNGPGSFLGGAGNPDYDLFARAKLPDVVYNTTSSRPFQSRDITPDGLVDKVQRRGYSNGMPGLPKGGTFR